MTMPEQAQPEEAPEPGATAQPEAFAREVEAIDVETLDKENRGWAEAYVSGLRERLTNEQAAAQPDFVMISYLKREIATYVELLERTGQG